MVDPKLENDLDMPHVSMLNLGFRYVQKGFVILLFL